MISFSTAHAKHRVWIPLILLLLNIGRVFGQSYNDVSLSKSASLATAAVGSQVVFTTKVFNEGKTSISGLTIHDPLPLGTAYIGHVSSPGTDYDPASGYWHIGNSMSATVGALTLEVHVSITGTGLIYSAAQVWAMNEYDVDSAPANHFILEDDHDAASVSVPIQICVALGETVTLKAPAGYADYQWFRDNGSGPVLVGSGIEYIADLPGSYSYSALSQSCPLGMSCALIVEECMMVNEPPVANLDTVSTPLNTPVVIDVLANDTDPENALDPSSVTIVNPPLNGIVTVHPDGTVTYIPNSDFSGLDTFLYQVCDSGMPVLCDTALVIVTVGDLFFDLALTKSLAPGQSLAVKLGDEIRYHLTVVNEGFFAATNIEITDFIPPGLVFGTNNPGWSLNADGHAVFALAGPLLPGDSFTVELVLRLLYGASGQTILNIAEVTQVFDIYGNPATDVDSVPNNNEIDEDDQDGQIIELIPHDPTGFLYCENSGEIILGGTIGVTGPGEVFIISDGSTGYYEFYTDGTPGIYQLSYNPPAGYVFSQNCLPQTGAIDPTGIPDPVVLGSDTLGGSLMDYSCAANPFWLFFELEPGDPYIFNNNIPLVCPVQAVPGDTVVISHNCDLSEPLYCFDVPYDQLVNYQFTLNGSPYNAQFGPCSLVRDRYYTYVSVLGFGTTGPYKLEYWNVNGKVHTANFQDINDLVVLMNQWDTNGNWAHDPAARTFSGGHPHSFYGKMIIRHVNTGSVAELELNELYAIDRTYVIVPEGEHVLVITNTVTGDSKTVNLRVQCVSPDYVEITQPVGSADTICLNTDELLGEVAAIFNPCLEGFNNASDLNVIPGTNCVQAFGLFPGVTNACYVICDDVGVCDTTYIKVTVFAQDLVPHNDTLFTLVDLPVNGGILSNDEIPVPVVSVTITGQPRHGTVIVNPDNTVTYTPNPGYCNDGDPLDRFTYQVCTATQCKTAFVYVHVKCNGIIVYNGFSPNGDGVNEFFRIDGLGDYPNHNIMVFNRWGNKVFEAKNYRNDWNGWWHDKKLPVGTYFYMIDLGDGSDWLSGYLQIHW